MLGAQGMETVGEYICVYFSWYNVCIFFKPAKRWCTKGPHLRLGPFHIGLPWASLFLYGRSGGGEGWDISFLAAAPQLVPYPLTQVYEEWRRDCVLTEWMDRKDTETGLYVPVLQAVGVTEGVLLHVLPGSQEDRRFQTHFRSAQPKPMHCPQDVPYNDHHTDNWNRSSWETGSPPST